MTDASKKPHVLTPGRAAAVPLLFAAALVALALGTFVRREADLLPRVLGAAGVLLAWAFGFWLAARREGRSLTLQIAFHRHHWVQACAQILVFAYWGWHVRFVYAFMPLILAQILFAYGVEALVNWSRRDVHQLGFGPFPIVLSINLFLWFKPAWFHWQFAMILIGYVAKELIRWQRDGRSRHIFNPSSFPLAAFSLVLLVTGTTGVTLGPEIAQTQFNPPYMYLCIFLVSVPAQLLFGVARMTMAAVASMIAISWGYFALTGTYLFFDAFISLPVFLGMHLLFTDPSTSPRTESGQIAFGVLYSLLTVGCFAVLASIDAPRFYDKLLPVPLMNLMVRRIDLIARGDLLARFDPSRIGRALSPRVRNAAYTSVWVVMFVALRSVGAVGDHHPGQYLPFWQEACEAGSDRACTYAAYMRANYCEKGSGWACNEWGVEMAESGRVGDAAGAFRRGCDLGFSPACGNATRAATSGAAAMSTGYARSQPRMEDLPVVLRGSKGPVRERDPARLLTMACEQGWPGACDVRLGTTGGA